MIFEVALEEYTKTTEKDIKSDPLFAKLQECKSSDAVLEVLEKQALAFEQYRKGDRKVQLMSRLRPIVGILFQLSTKDDVKKDIVSVRLTEYNYSAEFYHPPSRYFHQRRPYLLVLVSCFRCVLFPSLPAVSAFLTPNLKAAKRVGDDYDMLIELFQHFERYLRRLQVFTEIPPALGEILVKIMVELLGVLALTTQQIKQGRVSESALADTFHLAEHDAEKFAEKLFVGHNNVEQVLQRLEQLTEEELRMTATQTFEVVNGLFNDLKVVIDGMEIFA